LREFNGASDQGRKKMKDGKFALEVALREGGNVTGGYKGLVNRHVERGRFADVRYNSNSNFHVVHSESTLGS